MILPFAVNAIAVFIFRQFFLQLPKELFESARLDGASRAEDPHPDRHPAGQAGHPHRGDRHLHRPLERVPVAVPGHQAARPAAAGGGPGQLHLQRGRPPGQPVRGHPGRRGGAGDPGGGPVPGLPEASSRPATSAPGSRDDAGRVRGGGLDGPPPRRRHGPRPRRPPRGLGGAATRPDARGLDGELYLFPRLVAEGNWLADRAGPGPLRRRPARRGRAARDRPGAGGAVGAAPGRRRGRGPADHLSWPPSVAT